MRGVRGMRGNTGTFTAPAAAAAGGLLLNGGTGTEGTGKASGTQYFFCRSLSWQSLLLGKTSLCVAPQHLESSSMAPQYS